MSYYYKKESVELFSFIYVKVVERPSKNERRDTPHLNRYGISGIRVRHVHNLYKK